jgi:hypothetical protein
MRGLLGGEGRDPRWLFVMYKVSAARLAVDAYSVRKGGVVRTHYLSLLRMLHTCVRASPIP